MASPLNHWSSKPDDPLEVAAAEWLVLRPAGQPKSDAARLVERALAAAYLRRRNHSTTARRVMA